MTLKQFPTGATIVQKPKQARLILAYLDNDIPDLFRRLGSIHDYTLGETFTWMIEEVASSDRLQAKLLAFHDRTEDFWADFGSRKQFFISNGVDASIRSLAESLTFALMGHGNLSELFRLLVRFYAVRNKLIDEPTRRPRASKKHEADAKTEKKVESIREVAAQAGKAKNTQKTTTDVSVSFTIDKQTDNYINKIVPFMEKKRMSVLRTMIEEIGTDEHNVRKLQEFYKRKWSLRPRNGGPAQLARFNYSPQLDALLLYLSMRITGTRNKSRMVRVLTEFYYNTHVATA